MFDYERFTKLCKLAYRRIDDCSYSFDDVMQVLTYYIDTYSLILEKPHAMLSVEQIAHIIKCMPYVDNPELPFDCTEYVSPDDYYDMIDKHFATRYRNCDYNIIHFFTGAIRFYRMH